MRHHEHLAAAERERLFLCPPEPFDASSPRDLLAMALGATLYCPAGRPALAETLVRRRASGVTSMVLCLEDAVADTDVAAAEDNLVHHLRAAADQRAELPAVFVRIRTTEQIPRLVRRLGAATAVLAGFVLPKFDECEGKQQLQAAAEASDRIGRRLYVMPVVESAEVASLETRNAALTGIRRVLEQFAASVLVVRIGATDLGGYYGLRRSREHTVYDVAVLSELIGHVVNVFGRATDGWPVSGPVWEHFPSAERLFRPLLRATPFERQSERRLRAELLARDLDGLIREVALDRANGLTGKTVIHPSHVPVVHALSVVSHEEWADATDVLGTAGAGGVAASTYRNKMNESKPHTAWARRTELRARAFGVARPETSFVDLLAATLRL